MTTIPQALSVLKPNSTWSVNGPNYSDIVWFGPDPKPTQQEVADQIAAMDTATAAEDTRVTNIKADTNLQSMLTQARSATVGQIDTWISNNVTTLAQARTVLAAIVKYIATLEG